MFRHFSSSYMNASLYPITFGCLIDASIRTSFRAFSRSFWLNGLMFTYTAAESEDIATTYLHQGVGLPVPVPDDLVHLGVRALAQFVKDLEILDGRGLWHRLHLYINIQII